MDYLKARTLDAPGGTVLVSPSDVVFIHKRPVGSELQLSSGVRVAVSMSDFSAAEALWQFPNQTDNGCYNDEHVLAVVPDGNGSRVHFTGGLTYALPMPVNHFIESLRKIQAERANLRAAKEN